MVHTPPLGFVDFWDWSRIRDDRDGVRTGRLAPWLRKAAHTRDPQEILKRAVVAIFRPTTGNASLESRALADLSVTGRAAYAAFTASPPRDETLLAAVQPALTDLGSDRLSRVVRDVLDRAYSVAWALRGAPSQRSALRAGLGWIAVSGEDDPAHAPTNVPASAELVGELSMRIGRRAQLAVIRATLTLPTAPTAERAPDIARRQVPGSTAFADALQDRAAAGYDELFLFVHGLGSRAEESGTFKRALIDSGKARGKRYGVLSVDMPGMGYSSRINLDELVTRRARGHHGFNLPDGVGSNFPVLGLYRDTLVEICNQTAGGVQYVMGGSLGGNLTLWLAAEPMFSDLVPERAAPLSVVKFLSWSPASIWESYERSRPLGDPKPLDRNSGTHWDLGKNGAKTRTLRRMLESEDEGRRKGFFETMQRGEEFLGLHVLGAWEYPPTAGTLLQQAELYSADYRRMFWAASYEQVTFSHREPLTPSRRWPFETIRKPLLLVGGSSDIGEHKVMDIYNNVIEVSDRFPDVPGVRHLLRGVGHSISDDQPRHLAELIVDFVSGPAVWPPSGSKPYDVYWSAERGDNFTTATEPGRRDAVAAGYRHARTEGYVLVERRPGTVPLDLYWSASRGDNFTTATDVGRRDAVAAGYQRVRTEGFVFSRQPTDQLAVELNLYWSAARGDNFVSATLGGRRDAEAAGYRFVRAEGFVIPRAIALRAHNHQHVSAVGGGGGAVTASSPHIRAHETFEVVYLPGNMIALRTSNDFYLCAEGGGGRELVANRSWIGDWEKFRFELTPGCIALKAANGQFVCAEDGGGGALVANRSRRDIWEMFQVICV